jgi:isoquinoline 1-oxidoreductase subunit beta
MSDGERQQLLLRQVRRQAAVVQRVAQKAGWGDTTPKDTGLGIATTFGQERNMPTSIACVARVAADRRSGVVRVERLTIVVDAGTIVDPDGALAQIEGGALWASAWRSTKARNSSRGR